MTDGAPLHQLSALQLRDALAEGAVSAQEATSHYLQRIAGLNPRLGAFVAVTADQAMADAAAADRRRAARLPLPPLHGLPTAFKDLTDVRGVATTYGSAAVEHVRATEDAPLVADLRAAGMIVLGKTQVPEFGLSCHSESRVGPPARHPLDLLLSPGGSSGGSAAAVAAGMLPVAPGTDGGGSVRIPAAATGLVGLKPSRGRVPGGSGQRDLGQLVVAGPLARSAADAGLLLDAMAAGFNPRATSAPDSPAFLDAALRADGTFRIGVSLESPFAARYDVTVSTEARAALSAGIRELGGTGHDVVETAFRYDPRYAAAFQTVWTASLTVVPLLPDAEEKLTPLARVMRERALACPAKDLVAAIDTLRQFEEETIRQYASYDMVLTPALAQTPRPLGWYTGAGADEDYERQCLYTPFTSMVNVCGLPALTVPTDATAEGLPMGIQLIGRPGGEAQLLSVAAQLEAG
jgi:amidase